MSSQAAQDRYPSQVAYIIGTEGCERICFYGMTSILTLYLVRFRNWPNADAESFYHVFSAAVWLMPLLGGWISDRFLGRYRTILFVSFGYVAGPAVLALWGDSLGGLYLGCALIALGAGGVKPCVSAFVGDQFSPQQGHLLERMYGWFYFAINIGSLGGQFFIPKLLDWYGPRVAFGAPGVAMVIALVLYLMGRKRYVKPPATGPNPNGFLRVSFHALTHKGQPGQSRLDAARSRFPEEAILGVRATLRILLIFLLISIFWALFFQFGSTWVLQAERMNLRLFSWTLNPAQIAVLNATFVLLLIPVMNALYKARERRGRPVGALRKMTAGMFIASLSFVAAMVVEMFIERGSNPHALWQIVQYFFISLAEVLVSVTGLEFAYTQAPRSMKSTIMGFWFVAMALGNVLTAAVAFAKAFSPVGFFAFFAALMFVAACVFWLVARWYKPAYAAAPAPQAG